MPSARTARQKECPGPAARYAPPIAASPHIHGLGNRAAHKPPPHPQKESPHPGDKPSFHGEPHAPPALPPHPESSTDAPAAPHNASARKNTPFARSRPTESPSTLRPRPRPPRNPANSPRLNQPYFPQNCPFVSLPSKCLCRSANCDKLVTISPFDDIAANRTLRLP